MRSLARDLGVVSSAVYRYVRSRDDLLTLLVVDAYDELGDLADAAAARRRPATTPGGSVRSPTPCATGRWPSPPATR